jgi:Stage II sporulation protein E (SpoIIE)
MHRSGSDAGHAAPMWNGAPTVAGASGSLRQPRRLSPRPIACGSRIESGSRLEPDGRPLRRMPRRGLKAQAEGRVRYLRAIGSALASTLDQDEALRRLSRLLVPGFADWCAMVLVAEGTMAKTLVARRGLVDFIELESEALPPFAGVEQERSDLGEVLRGGPSVLLRRIFRSASFRPRGTIIVSLTGRHRRGALMLVRTSRLRAYGQADLVVADNIGSRAAMALENAIVHAEQRGIAETLQRRLLPVLPQVAPLKLGATYVPARRGTEVGGDWYDSFVLPDGAVAIILGDVAGHDLMATVRMSDVRSFLRAASLRSNDPATVIEQLDETMAQFTGHTTATVVFGRVERSGSNYALRWSNAGHPSPLLVLPDTTTRYLDTPPDVLVGAGSQLARRTHVEPLPPPAASSCSTATGSWRTGITVRNGGCSGSGDPPPS